MLLLLLLFAALSSCCGEVLMQSLQHVVAVSAGVGR